MILTDKWDIRFMAMAEMVAGWSKDPACKVGAVLASYDHRVLGLGYNGFPQMMSDSPSLLDNRDIKLPLTIHAEENAFINASGSRFPGSTMYIWPFQPCAHCAALIAQHQVFRVVSYASDVVRWRDSMNLGEYLLREVGVTLELYQRQ